MSSQPLQIGRRHDKERIAERAKLVRQAKLLAWLGVGWHGIEATIAVVAGLAASSIALLGFGADSLIESVAGISCSGASPPRASPPKTPSGAPRSSSP